MANPTAAVYFCKHPPEQITGDAAYEALEAFIRGCPSSSKGEGLLNRRRRGQVQLPAIFTRHRYELPMLAILFAVGLVELVVVHLLVALWSPIAALVLTTLTALSLVPFAMLMHGLVKWPTTIEEAGVRVRHGRRREIFVPLTQIAGSENVAFRAEERGPQVFRATLMAHPNVVLRLSEPLLHGRRRLESIAMRLDEPAAFQAALSARLTGSPDPSSSGAAPKDGDQAVLP